MPQNPPKASRGHARPARQPRADDVFPKTPLYFGFVLRMPDECLPLGSRTPATPRPSMVPIFTSVCPSPLMARIVPATPEAEAAVLRLQPFHAIVDRSVAALHHGHPFARECVWDIEPNARSDPRLLEPNRQKCRRRTSTAFVAPLGSRSIPGNGMILRSRSSCDARISRNTTQRVLRPSVDRPSHLSSPPRKCGTAALGCVSAVSRMILRTQATFAAD